MIPKSGYRFSEKDHAPRIRNTRPICRSELENVPADSAASPLPSGLPIVALRDVGKTFANGVVALDRLDLDVRPGEFVSLLGPSGCGKSTALRIIAGLSEPSRGKIDWSQPEEGATPVRLGFVFQEP